MCLPKPDPSRNKDFEQLPFDALSEEFLDKLEEVQIAIFDKVGPFKMPPTRSYGKEMGQRGLNGTEFLYRCQRVIECINQQVFPRVPDLLFPYVHH